MPLWLALLLKKQRRANIVPPPWLHPAALAELVHYETKVDPTGFSPPAPPPSRPDLRRPGRARRVNDDDGGGGGDVEEDRRSRARRGRSPLLRDLRQRQPLEDDHRKPHLAEAAAQRGDETDDSGRPPPLSPPFLPTSCTAAAPAAHLPYHWLEVAEALLVHAADDVAGAAEARSHLRALQEARAAKMRAGTASVAGGATESGGGGGVTSLRGVGAMELAESRGFVLAAADGARHIGASAEAARREAEEEAAQNEDDDAGLGFGAADSDEEMEL